MRQRPHVLSLAANLRVQRDLLLFSDVLLGKWESRTQAKISLTEHNELFPGQGARINCRRASFALS